MYTLYAEGKPVGTLADAARLIPELIAKNQRVELRDDDGVQVGVVTPTPKPDPSAPVIPWEPNVTREELERRLNGPFVTFEELKKRLGWE